MSAEIKTLHQPFAKWLRQEKIPYISARSDRQSTISLGAHDFTVFLPGNRVLAIEFKDKGILSADQLRWIEKMKEAGCTVYVIRKIEDAVALVQEWRASLLPLSPPATDDKTPAAPRQDSPFRLLQWCGQTWTVASATKGGTGWSLLHKSTPEELAALKPV